MKATRGEGLLEAWLSKLRYRKADSLIPESYRNGRILDIGCGYNPVGLMNIRFAQKWGIDKLVDSEKSKYFEEHHNIRLKQVDLEKDEALPFEDNFFDVVTMLAVIEHISPERIPWILGEIRRILKPSGILILTTPSPYAELPLNILSRIGLVSKEEIDEHKDLLSIQKVEKLLRESGFENVSVGYFELVFNIWAKAQKKEIL